jgi:hypothetical protein
LGRQSLQWATHQGPLLGPSLAHSLSRQHSRSRQQRRERQSSYLAIRGRSRGHRRPLWAALPRRCPAQAALVPGGSPWAARTGRLPRTGASRAASVLQSRRSMSNLQHSNSHPRSLPKLRSNTPGLDRESAFPFDPASALTLPRMVCGTCPHCLHKHPAIA